MMNKIKRLLHRLFMPLYELGYSIWLQIGRRLYYDEVFIVRGDNENYE